MREVGVRLVAKDYQQYIRQLNDAGTATTGVGRSAVGAAQQLSSFNIAGIPIVATLGDIANAAQFVTNKIIGMGRSALRATATHEQLTMSMSSLVAKEIRAADTTLDMEQAMDLASERAGELLAWIQELAIKSPFDQQGVAMAFKTGLTYGFTSEQAQKLTETLVNFATATGQSSAVINQLAYPLGQLKNTGKALTQDLRQLTNAGVDVTGILKEMGYGWEDVSRGVVSSDEFIKTFVATLDRDFGGAAKRSAETVNGLLNSVEDLGEIGLRQAFGPAIQAALPALSMFVNKLQEGMPAIRAFGEGLGSVVSVLFDSFIPAMDDQTPLENWMDSMGLLEKKTEAMSNNMFDYGANAVVSFAEGMASALGYIFDVLASIGSAIAYWLAPGSPPKLLPDIDVWGESAMNEFVGGFKKADFGVFGQISGMIEKMWRAQGDQDDVTLVPRLVEMREEVAALVAEFSKTGEISTRALDDMLSRIGEVTSDTRKYLTALVEVQAAQQKLDAINKRFQETVEPLNKELQEIAERRREVTEGKREEELQKIVSDENAPALAKELALMELREIEIKKQIRAAEEQAKTEGEAVMSELELAQERLAIQQLIIDNQTEQNKLIKEQIGLLKKLNKAGGGGGAGGGRGGAGKGMPKPGDLDFGAGLGDQVGDAFKERVEALKKDVEDALEPLRTKIDNFKEQWGIAFDNARIKVETFWYDGVKPVLDALGLETGEAILLAFQLYAGWKTVSSVMTVYNNAVLPSITLISALWKASGGLAGALATVKLGLGGVIAFLTGPLGIALIAASIAVGTLIAKFGGLPGAIEAVRGTFTGGGTFGPDGPIAQALPLIRDTAIQAVTDFSTQVKAWFADAKQGAVSSILDLISGVETNLQELFGRMGLSLDEMREKWRTIFNDVKQIVITVARNTKDGVTAVWLGLRDQAGIILDQLKVRFSKAWDSIEATTKTAWAGIKEWAVQGVLDMIAGVQEKMGELKTWFDEQVQPWVTMGEALIKGLGQGILNMAGELIRNVTDTVGDAVDAAKEYLGIQSPSRMFIEMGKQTALGLEIGMSTINMNEMVMSFRYMASEMVRTISTMNQQMSNLVALSSQVAVAPSNTYVTNTINMNNQINNGMDMAVFEAAVERVVARALT